MSAFDGIDFFKDHPAAPGPGEFSKGIRSGTLGLGANVANAAGAIGTSLGFDQFGRNAYATADDLNQQAQLAAPRVTSFRSIGAPGGQGYVNDALDWAAGTLGSTVPSAALGVGAGMLAPAGLAGGMLAGTAAYTLPETGDVVGRMREQGQPIEVGKALGTGLLSAAGQSIVPAIVGGKLAGKAASTAPMTLRQAGRTLATETGLEAASEGGSEAGKQLATGKTLDTLDWGQIADNTAGGAMGGLGMSGVGVAGEYAHGKAGAVSEGLQSAKDGATGLLASAKDKIAGKGKGAEPAAEPAPARRDYFDTLADLWDEGKTRAKDTLRKVADSEDIVGDAKAFAGAQGDKLKAMLADDDGQRMQAVERYAQELADKVLTPEQQQAVADWAADKSNTAKQAVVANIKRAKDAAQSFTTRVDDFVNEMKFKRGSGGDGEVVDMEPAGPKRLGGPKKSEDFSGAREAILKEVVPVLMKARPELASNIDQGTLAKVGDGLRMLVTELTSGKKPSSNSVATLIDLFGPQMTDVLEATHRAVGDMGDKKGAAAFFKSLNDMVDAQRNRDDIVGTLRKHLKPEFQKSVNDAELALEARTMEKWAADARKAANDPEFQYRDRKARTALAARYADPDAVMAALEARAGHDENMIADQSRAGKTESDQHGVESELDDPASDMREVTMDDGVDSTIFWGKGNQLYEDPTGKETVTAKDGKTYPHATLQAIERAKTMHPDKAVQFRSAKDLGMDHPAIAKRVQAIAEQLQGEGRSAEEAKTLAEQAVSKYGLVTGESARNEQSVSMPEIDELTFDTKRYKTGPARLDTKGSGVEGNYALDGIKLTRWAESKSQEHYTERDDKGYKHRKARMFMEGVAAVQARLGYSFEIPDSTQITSTGLTWGDVKNLKALGENSEQLYKRANAAQKEFAELTAGRPMKKDGTLSWYPAGSEKAKALRKSESDAKFYRERADQTKAQELLDEATRADGGRPDNKTIQKLIDEADEGVAAVLRDILKSRKDNNVFEGSVDDPGDLQVETHADPETRGKPSRDNVHAATFNANPRDAEVRTNLSGLGRKQDTGGLDAGDLSGARFALHTELAGVARDGRKVRPANKRQQTLIGEAVGTMRTALSDAIDAVQFAVHDGEGVPAASIYYNANGPVIGLRPDVLRGADSANETAKQRLIRVVGHELGHEADRQSGWESERAVSLQPGGRVFEEARTVTEPRLQGAYAKIFDGGRDDAKNSRELYAQIVGLYHAYPELLREHQPLAYAAIQRQTDQRVAAYGEAQAQSVLERQRVAEGNRTSAPAGQEGAARRADGLGRVASDAMGRGVEAVRDKRRMQGDPDPFLKTGTQLDFGGEQFEFREAPPRPKAVAAKKAALKEAASSGDPALLKELATSNDAAGLQRAVEALNTGKVDADTQAAIDTANDRIAELVRANASLAYGLQTKRYSLLQMGRKPITQDAEALNLMAKMGWHFDELSLERFSTRSRETAWRAMLNETLTIKDVRDASRLNDGTWAGKGRALSHLNRILDERFGDTVAELRRRMEGMPREMDLAAEHFGSMPDARTAGEKARDKMADRARTLQIAARTDDVLESMAHEHAEGEIWQNRAEADMEGGEYDEADYEKDLAFYHDRALKKLQAERERARKEAPGWEQHEYDESRDVQFSRQDARGATPGEGPVNRREVYNYIRRVLGDKIGIAWKDFLHAGEFERMEMPDGSTEDIIRLSIHSLNPLSTAHHEALHAFFERLRDLKQGNVMDVLERAANSAPVMNQLRKLLADHPEALKQLNNSEERAAYMYQFWAAGKLTVGDQTRNVFQRIADFVRSVLGIWSNDERALHILEYFHSGEFAKDSTKQFARDAVNEKLMNVGRNGALEAAKRMTQPFRDLGESLAVAGGARLRDTGIPALRQLADAMKLHGTDEGEDAGFVPAARAARTQVMNDLGAKLKGFSEASINAALDSLQSKSNAPIKALVDTQARADAYTAKAHVRNTLDDMYNYMRAQGVDVKDLGVGTDYFPRQYDTSFISSHQQEFMNVLAKHDVANPKRTMEKIIGAEGAEFTVETDKPGMQSLKVRTLAHIPDAELAPFMRKNLFEVMNSYVTQATRRGEWARRFGEKNERLNDLMQAAQRQGATPDQMKAAQNFVRSVDGTLGDTINPEARRLIGNMIVYQNIRLLPLAIFSSVVDPVGIMVRGGTMREAFSTFSRGVREVVKNFKKNATDDEMTKLAAQMGVIDDTTLVHTLGALYSQGMVGDTGRKINDTFFRYNLMEQFNTSMRVGATEAALNFLARHADGKASPHSVRWLNELGLKPGDVKLGADGRPDVTDPRIKMAVNRWVDGAVLRPDAVDKPVWMSDPHFALFAHLKQFVFSFHETILKRVGHEFDHGNYAPAMALASYVPVMIAADLIKGFIQGGGDQPEWKQNWGLSDYLMSGVERGGLLGTGQFAADAFKDIRQGGSGIGALMGPTVEQLTDAVRVIGGRAQFDRFAIKSMPANALYASALGGEATDPKFAD